MKLQWIVAMVFGAGALGLLAGQGIAEEDPAKGAGGGMPMAQKGPEHKEFAGLVGDWNASTKYWMAPGGEPMVSNDSASCKLIMKGWWMEMTYKGSAMGQPWTGRLTVGYDQTRKKHIHMWITDMGSDVSIDWGNENKDGVLVMRGESKDMMTQKLRPTETTFEVKDANTMIMTMYWCTAEKKRASKMLEITYTRKKTKKEGE